jgi:hypothetical protein
MLQRGTFRRSRVYTQVPLHRGAFWHRYFLYAILLHSAFTCQFFDAEILLPANTFKQRYFDTTSLRDDVFLTGAFFTRTRAHALTEMFLTRTLLHRDSCTQRTFTQRCFHTEMAPETLSHTHTHTHTQKLLHRDDFALSNFAHRYHYKQRRFYEGMDLHEELLYTDVLHRHTFAWFPTAGPHLAQQADVKPQFHRSFWWSRRISWERVGPAQAYIEISFQFLAIDISCERVVFRGLVAVDVHLHLHNCHF